MHQHRHVVADLIRNPEVMGKAGQTTRQNQPTWRGRHTGFKAVSTARDTPCNAAIHPTTHPIAIILYNSYLIQTLHQHPQPIPKLKPYPKYKPSNIQWLGDIPEHWSATRLKYLATINDEALSDTTEPSQELHYVDIGSVHPTKWITEIQEIDFENAPSRARRIVRRGDVIVSTVRTYLRAIAPTRARRIVRRGDVIVSTVRTYLRAIAPIKIDDPNLIISTGFAVIRPERLDEGFAAYALQASHFVEQVVANSVGVSYPAINATEMAGFPIPHPSIPEQRAIADYLDHQTALMDALVAKKKRMIELLAERRQSLITHAVTKGLDPQAHTRDSGIEWIGDVPEHWSVMLLKRITRIKSGVSLPASFDKELGRYEVYGANGVIGFSDEFLIQQPTLIVGRVGTSGAVNIAPACTWISDNALMLTELPRNIAFNWLGHVLSCMRLETLAEKNAQPIITAANLSKQHIPVPPNSEQHAIADYLDHQTSIMDALTEKLNRLIELLAERRQSLITHAVTGKIDVRGHKAAATPA